MEVLCGYISVNFTLCLCCGTLLLLRWLICRYYLRSGRWVQWFCSKKRLRVKIYWRNNKTRAPYGWSRGYGSIRSQNLASGQCIDAIIRAVSWLQGNQPWILYLLWCCTFHSSTILWVSTQREHVFPRHLKAFKVCIYLPSCSSVAIRPCSFTPKVKRVFSAAQECYNTGFFWSGYCVCLPGFKLLPDRHFRGHHSVVSEREPDVDFVPRGSMSVWPLLTSFIPL